MKNREIEKSNASSYAINKGGHGVKRVGCIVIVNFRMEDIRDIGIFVC